MTHEIHLTGLRAYGHHGVFDFEKADGQEFSVDVLLTGDFSQAAQTDRLDDTVDYGAVAELAAKIVSTERYDLIEALAARIAGAIAGTITIPCTVSVTVHKPSAPIAHDFADVTVRASAISHGKANTPTQAGGTSSEQRITAILSLGANRDNPRGQLEDALRAIDRLPRVEVVHASGFYATAPVGGVEQDDFVNCAAVVEAACSPRELLAALQGIEAAQGRVRDVRWGPRTLDIDIIRLTAADSDIDSPDAQTTSSDPILTLPHPRAHERAFVLVPWAEIRPHARISHGGAQILVSEAGSRVQAAEPAQTVRRLD
ncbi:2-amino-4-hydroxy-6-hydroxymethyldihydropteridine diphosphokinase [Brevibacterium sp. Marseille-P9724]|uniref:2-amino-4-hydroxy-6- hydroxymethyldihydropteridine diphosphokinase n=1 Tax=Brevibacterium sp. Marseille-P9724 TaxID=2614125 RepID=UPI00125FDF93|nr:2-amino-4-hydroxy-6-hydroxymethyldihydropteridine diphosphokinase [Brevibacterium sp. Marseille-P9724]